MSRVQHRPLDCPACGAEHPATLFISLNARRLPHHVAEIAAGDFEVQTCAGCGHRWQPEHRMLLSWPERRLWAVMLPPDQRPRAAALERAVLDLMRREFDAAPDLVKPRLDGNETLLVFGQQALAERVRLAALGLDHGAVEHLKLDLRDRWAVASEADLRLLGLDDDAARFAVVGPAGVERTAALDRSAFDAALAPAAVERARAAHPILFDAPWCDARRVFAEGGLAR